MQHRYLTTFPSPIPETFYVTIHVRNCTGGMNSILLQHNSDGGLFSKCWAVLSLQLIPPLSCSQISSWSSTPLVHCWPSSMALPLLKSWIWPPPAAAAAPTPPVTSSPLPALILGWRLSHPQSCWTTASSWGSDLAAPWSAWSLWQRPRPAQRHSSTCVNSVLLVLRPESPLSLTECEQEQNWDVRFLRGMNRTEESTGLVEEDLWFVSCTHF